MDSDRQTWAGCLGFAGSSRLLEVLLSRKREPCGSHGREGISTRPNRHVAKSESVVTAAVSLVARLPKSEIAFGFVDKAIPCTLIRQEPFRPGPAHFNGLFVHTRVTMDTGFQKVE